MRGKAEGAQAWSDEGSEVGSRSRMSAPKVVGGRVQAGVENKYRDEKASRQKQAQCEVTNNLPSAVRSRKKRPTGFIGGGSSKSERGL